MQRCSSGCWDTGRNQDCINIRSKGKMTLDGRYTLGMSKTPDSDPVSIDIKNTNISFMLGYGF